MSHIPQRQEKDCLNCGTIVQGRYCQNCGQENVVPKETFWHMFTHFFYDITHFDSSFFHTVHHLVFKPGFLSKEYMAGKRVSYLHPIRMYVFTSAMFFLLFFSIFKTEAIKTNTNEPASMDDRRETALGLQRALKKDTGNTEWKESIKILKDSSRHLTKGELARMAGPTNNISITGRSYRTESEYDSMQSILPKAERDGWLLRRLIRKQIEVNNKFRENPDEALKKLSESVLHRLPYMLFVSLPLFALILKLVYFRRKQFYYSDHGVFTIHLYVFTFLLLMLVFGISRLQQATGWSLDLIIVALVILMYFYLYKAMRRFYMQRRAKTILKFMLVCILSMIMMIILFAFFIFFSAFTL